MRLWDFGSWMRAVEDLLRIKDPQILEALSGVPTLPNNICLFICAHMSTLKLFFLGDGVGLKFVLPFRVQAIATLLDLFSVMCDFTPEIF